MCIDRDENRKEMAILSLPVHRTLNSFQIIFPTEIFKRNVILRLDTRSQQDQEEGKEKERKKKYIEKQRVHRSADASQVPHLDTCQPAASLKES